MKPTNHLDLSAVQYLEEYLTAHAVTALVVSHDAHFLDAVCTDMIKFEDAKLKYHVGNYTSFREMEEQVRAIEKTCNSDRMAYSALPIPALFGPLDAHGSASFHVTLLQALL